MQAAEAPKAGARYRSDIDGLRALAVLMVLGSHLGVPRMVGGYIGVDIFFVISGYLITGIVARDIALSRFSLSGFYERRIRRIFPALLVVLLATLLPVYELFPPKSLVSYSYSLLGALFSYSNLYFATQAGYFADSYTKILQHTWSLGVEEQFYLVLPLCLLAFAKHSKRAMQWFVGIGWVVSFLWSAYAVLHDADLAFYMPYTRAWELLTGSALALNMVPFTPPKWLKEALGATGLLVLLLCMAHYRNTTIFPGPSALAVCLAAALLLKIGETGPSMTTAALRWRPVVFVGLISYSLYLWHWPILILLRLGLWHNIVGDTALQRLCITVACIAVATLSWRFVEQPFRAGVWKHLSRREIFLYSGAASTVLTLVAVAFIADRGVEHRFSPTALQVGTYFEKSQQMRAGTCFYETPRQTIRQAECLTAQPGKHNVLLLGDSHAAMFWQALHDAAPTANVMQFNVAGCYPFPDHYDRTNCGRGRRFLFEHYLPTAAPDEVIISIRWVDQKDAQTLEPLLHLLAERKIPVYLIGPVPEYRAPLPLLLMLGDKWHRPDLAETRRVDGLQSLDGFLADRFGHRPGVTYLSAYGLLCRVDSCREYLNPQHTVPLMPDNNHLTNEASLQMVQQWITERELTL